MKFEPAQIAEFFNKIDIKFRYAIFIGFLLLIFAIDFFTLMTFQWNTSWKMDKDNQALQQNITHLQTDIQRIAQMKAGLQKSRAQLEAMNIKIRPAGEVSAIVEDISNVANQAGVKIDQLTPQPEGQKLLTSNETIKYYVLPIVIKATSGYHMFGYFLNRLELGQFLMIISSFSIEQQDAANNQQVFNANLKIVLSDSGKDNNTDGHKK